MTWTGAIPVSTAFTIPALTRGNHSVSIVTSAADTSTAQSLSVTSSIMLIPTVGHVGDSVYLTGNGFYASSTISTYWDSTLVNTITTNSTGSFAINFAVPQTSAGLHTIVSTDTYYGYSATSTFTVSTSVSLSSASVTIGSQLTISGSGFANSSNIYILINGTQVASTVSNASGAFSYNLTMPASPHGTYTLSVSDTLGNTASSSFTVNAAVKISPASFTGGSTISVTGTGFAAYSVISALIDGNVVSANAATADSTGSFTIASYTVPKMPGGSHTFQLTDTSGDAVTANFSITQAITITPTSGAPGTNVQVTGNGFSANSAITISFDGNNVTLSTTPRADSTGTFSASFAVPRASGGNHPVMASDGTFSATAVFNVTSSAKIDPVTGPVGTTVTVTGSSFGSSGAITITFNSTPVAAVTADAAGSFSTTFAVPQSAAGARPVVVTDGTRSATFSFAVTASVTVNPTTGYVGSSITVNGTGFTSNGQISIKYDGTQVASATSNAVGSFAVVFNAPVSKGGNHSISVSDNANTVTATFAMDSTPPPVPPLSLPLNGTKADALAEFQWGAVTDPSGVTYDLEVSRDQSFSVLIINETGLTTPGYQLTAQQKLSPASRSKPYYWRVRAVDGASNTSDWSPTQTFVVGFVMPSWAMYLIFAVVVVLAFLLGMWLGGRRRRVAPPPAAS